jgi:hypothetical protein
MPINSRHIRGVYRNQDSISYWQQRKFAEATLTTRQATPEELANRKSDPNRAF